MLSVKNSSPRGMFWLSAKNSSPRVFFFAVNYFFTLGEELFAESPSFGSHQSLLLSAKALFPIVVQPVTIST
jgi:hypothetical protein